MTARPQSIDDVIANINRRIHTRAGNFRCPILRGDLFDKMIGKSSQQVFGFNDPGDMPINSLGRLRYMIGYYFEMLAVQLTSCTHTPSCNKRKVNPDLKLSDQVHFEVKGSGKNNQLILYKSRKEKYDDWCELHDKELYYILFKHQLRGSEIETYSDLFKLSKATTKVYLVNYEVAHSFVDGVNHRIVNGSHSNDDYHLGWTITLSKYNDVNLLECKSIPNTMPAIIPFRTTVAG